MSALTLADEIDALVKQVPDLSETSATKWKELRALAATKLGMPTDEVQFSFIADPGVVNNRLGQGGPNAPKTHVVFGLMGDVSVLDKGIGLLLAQAKGRPDRAIVLFAKDAGGTWTPRRILGVPSRARSAAANLLPGVEVTSPTIAAGVLEAQADPEKGCFEGFSVDAFQFLAELQQNNTKEWMHARRDEFESLIDRPFRCLVEALAPHVLRLSSEFETRAKAGATLSRINRQNTTKGTYHTWYWAAFYRKSAGTKHHDVQLFVGVTPFGFVHGLFFGEDISTQQLADRLREVAKTREADLRAVLHGSGVIERFVFAGKDGQPMPVQTPDQLRAWTNQTHPRVFHVDAPNDAVVSDPAALLAHVVQDFQRLWPLYVLITSTTADPIIAARAALEGEDTTQDEAVESETESALDLDGLVAATCLEPSRLEQIERALRAKRQIILSGPPGTGKTFVAQLFAEYFTGSPDRVELIQFHPSYSYEDFIQGLRARTVRVGDRNELDYGVHDGIFVDVCDRARRAPEKRYVLLIDEVNRGNVARILGELLFLLEYRDKEAKLAYSQEVFQIPSNVYLIGTMNTADRSIALVDFALRRRFSFIPMAPDVKVLTCWLDGHAVSLKDVILKVYDRVNKDIDKPDYRIGHSHFMRDHTPQSLRDLWELELKPYLAEYFFATPDRVRTIGADIDVLVPPLEKNAPSA